MCTGEVRPGRRGPYVILRETSTENHTVLDTLGGPTDQQVRVVGRRKCDVLEHIGSMSQRSNDPGRKILVEGIRVLEHLNHVSAGTGAPS